MRYLSLFSGIEAASVAWHPIGWEPVAFSEIDPFPCAVLKERFPRVPNWGDITRFNEWPDACFCDSSEYDRAVGHGGMQRQRLVGREGELHVGSDGPSRGGDNPGHGEQDDNGTLSSTESVCVVCGGIRIELIVGGSPCQAFSTAGLRQGLGDPRGNLMLTYLAVVAKYRPRWIVWENVPGVLSTNGGRDFGTFLGGLGQCGYGAAFRILDTQYVRTREYPRAIPQRRRRVFVVGYLGDWRRAAAVLSIGQSVSWDPPPSRTSRQGVAGTLKGGSGERGYSDPSDGNGGGLIAIGALTRASNAGETVTHQDVMSNQLIVDGERSVGTLNARDCKGVGSQYVKEGELIVYENHQQDSRVKEMGDVCSTVVARYGTGVPLVATGRMVAFGEYADDGTASALKARDYKDATDLVAHTLTRRHNSSEDGSGRGTPIIDCPDPNKGQGGNVIAMRWREGKEGGGKGALLFDNHTGTLATNNDHTLFVSPSLTAANDPSRSPQASEVTQQVAAVYAASMAVRRLTPTECERLQGFPDGFTQIPYRGKPADSCPDGARYKALGNSMSINVMEWIGRRIQFVEEICAELEESRPLRGYKNHPKK